MISTEKLAEETDGYERDKSLRSENKENEWNNDN